MTSKEILLCSTPRSGSTILAEAMFRTKAMGYPDEFFNNDVNNKGDRPHTIYEGTYRKLGATSYTDYQHRLAQHYASDNGVHSVKMHFQHFRQALRSGYFHDPTDRFYVFIHRADVAAQAASLAIAMKTQKWNSRMRPNTTEDIRVPDELLARVYRELVFDNLRWKAFFEMFNVPHISLEYHEITADIGAAVQRIADHADIDLPTEVTQGLATKLTGKKQSNSLNTSLKDKLSDMRLDQFGNGNLLFDTGVLFA